MCQFPVPLHVKLSDKVFPAGHEQSEGHFGQLPLLKGLFINLLSKAENLTSRVCKEEADHEFFTTMEADNSIF